MSRGKCLRYRKIRVVSFWRFSTPELKVKIEEQRVKEPKDCNFLQKFTFSSLWSKMNLDYFRTWKVNCDVYQTSSWCLELSSNTVWDVLVLFSKLVPYILKNRKCQVRPGGFYQKIIEYHHKMFTKNHGKSWKKSKNQNLQFSLWTCFTHFYEL